MKDVIEEDMSAGATTAGGGQIAGIGVGPQGEPGVRPKVLRRKFAGNEVFEVDSECFGRCRIGKKKYERYENYVGNDETGQAIREYGLKNQGKAIVVQDKNTGAMMFLRYGKEKRNENTRRS